MASLNKSAGKAVSATSTRAASSPGNTAKALRRTASEGLSFCATYSTPRGRCVSRDHFDVPAEGYVEGRITGARAFVELVAHIRDAGAPPPPLLKSLIVSVLKDAAKASHEPGDRFSRRNRQGSSSNFLHLVAGVLEAALHSEWADEYARHELARSIHDRDFVAGLQKQRRDDFALRMKASKTRPSTNQKEAAHA